MSYLWQDGAIESPSGHTRGRADRGLRRSAFFRQACGVRPCRGLGGPHWRPVCCVSCRPQRPCCSLSLAAHAGGYDTGERDWDFLFQQDKFAAEAATRYIDPQRTLKNVVGRRLPDGPVDCANDRDRGFLGRALQRHGAADAAICAAWAAIAQPFEGHANYGHVVRRRLGDRAALHLRGLRADLRGLDAGGHGQPAVHRRRLLPDDQLRAAAELQHVPGGGPASTNVSDDGVGWRAGIGYEIPQYALRATLIYNSAIGYDMTGTGVACSRALATIRGPLAGSITMPQSVEFKAQSGVAPGWLAFGAIKWTNWSVDQDMALCAPGTTSCITGVNARAP